MNGLLANIPAALRAYDRFALWRMEPRYAGESPTKIPYDAKTHRRASSTDAATWSSSDLVLATYERCRARYDGIVFALGDDAPFVGVDFDDCRDRDTGIIAPAAMDLLNTFGTYGEISPSGGGVKLVGTGTMPTHDGTGKNYRPKTSWRDGQGPVEMYRRGRFFTLTGQRIETLPHEPRDITLPLAELYHRLYPAPPPRIECHRTCFDVDDNAKIRRAAAYLRKMEPSISGQRGHDRLLHAACVALRFGLSQGHARGLLDHYNSRAIPPWSDRELDRKIIEAEKIVSLAERGAMVNGHYHPALVRRQIYITVGAA